MPHVSDYTESMEVEDSGIYHVEAVLPGGIETAFRVVAISAEHARRIVEASGYRVTSVWRLVQ